MPERRTSGVMVGLTVGLIEDGATGVGSWRNGWDGRRRGQAPRWAMISPPAAACSAGGRREARRRCDRAFRRGGRSGFGSDSDAGRASDDVIGMAAVSIAGRGMRWRGLRSERRLRGQRLRHARGLLVSVRADVGKGGIGVRAVSLRGGGDDRRAATASGVMVGSVPVAGRAGGRLPCGTGSSVAERIRLSADKNLGLRIGDDDARRGERNAAGRGRNAPCARGHAARCRPAAAAARSRGDGSCSAGALDGTVPVSGGAAAGPGPRAAWTSWSRAASWSAARPDADSAAWEEPAAPSSRANPSEKRTA